jgi:hypothetical protein
MNPAFHLRWVRVRLLEFLNLSANNRRMRRVRRPFLAAMFLLTAVAAGLSGAGGGDAAIARTPQVVIIKKGLVSYGTDSSYAEYGLVLRNRSTKKDALNVTVNVRGLDTHRRAFTSTGNYITVIPSGSSFVVTGALVWNVSLNVARIATAVHVGRMAPRGRRLPPVRNVHLAQQGHDIVGSLTNPYKKPLPDSATVYGVFLDGSGRVVATDNLATNAVVKPGATVAFDLSGNFATTAQLNSVRSMKVSVDPCGDGFFAASCPIAGARWTG